MQPSGFLSFSQPVNSITARNLYHVRPYSPTYVFVMLTDIRTGQSFIAGYNNKRAEPMTYGVAETRLAKMTPLNFFSADLISVEEFNRRFERKD